MQTGNNGMSDFIIRDGVLVKYVGHERQVTIPDGVTTIGAEAFCLHITLDSVTIPKSVTGIEEVPYVAPRAFCALGRLKSVIYQGGLADWCAITGLGDMIRNNTKLYIGGKPIEGELVIPQGVTVISACAFQGFAGITSVVLPDSVTRIECEAFCLCKDLRKVQLGKGVQEIGAWAFAHCERLKTVVFPDSLKKIGEQAFHGGLQTVRYEGREEEWRKIEIAEENDGLKTAKLIFEGNPA